jgi:RNA 2',3'-cyclic 3'-phosphodiesterase
MDRPASHRLFFALWPDDALRIALHSFIQPLCRAESGLPVPAANLHVTLAFLGNVEPDRFPSLEALAATLKWSQADLVFDRLAFWQKNRLLCLEAANPPDAFIANVARLHDALRAAGFAIERRPFRPHLTLLRNVGRSTVDAGSPRPLQGFVWPARSITLVASTPTPEGSAYRPLRHWPKAG